MSKLVVTVALAAVACGPVSNPTPERTGGDFAAGAGENSTAAPAPQTNFSDTRCQVILRDATPNFESRLGPQTDCSSGTCWVIEFVTVDVAMSQVLAGSVPGVIYQGASGAWHTVSGVATTGAPLGFRRYSFQLDSDTFTNGATPNAVELIPFLRTVQGDSDFDHNVNSNPTSNYDLSVSDNWTYNWDTTTCPGATPAGLETLTFATGWQSSQSGSLIQSGKLDIDYDIYRIPQGLGCSTDGVYPFAVTAYAQFHPDNSVLTEEIDGPFNADAGVYTSVPAELDVPADATGVSLWFLDGSDCTGDSWDSNYGQNYNYSVAP